MMIGIDLEVELMYTEVKSYQYLIALLKKYGIKQCVLSAGSRNLPFVHSVESDPYFVCHSVVDERSAGYFALGLAQELDEPVVISCTSSTASCNYYPPVAEAFYQNIPLIVLTSDRDQRMVGQWEDQLIDQVGMYDRHVKKSVNLPVIKDHGDEIYCKRLINEALLEMSHNGSCGPVHINIPTDTYNRSFIVEKLPEVTKIERITVLDSESIGNKKAILRSAKRILVVCGQMYGVSETLKRQLSIFFEKFNCAIVGDYMSNVDIDEIINPSVFMDTNYITPAMVDELNPEIVISIGGQVFSGVKEQLKRKSGTFKHWSIDSSGNVVDMYKSLDTIFESKPEAVFEIFNADVEASNDKEYYNKFLKAKKDVKFPEFEFSSVYAIKNVVERIPEDSILHLSINDSIRITNFFELRKNIKTYANIGTHGIDGCMSSFIGQAVASDKPAFLVIGDLSFFYDMNSLKLNDLRKGSHILLINNHGGSEFYYNKIWQGDDRHTTARHGVKAKGWVEENNIKYLCAYDKESFDEVIGEFMSESQKPVLLEVFSEMSSDAEIIHNFYKYSRPNDAKAAAIRSAKDFVKEHIGQEKAKKIIDILRG